MYSEYHNSLDSDTSICYFSPVALSSLKGYNANEVEVQTVIFKLREFSSISDERFQDYRTFCT